MSAEKNWQFELEEYIKQGEPDQIEKSEAWQTAIGLQAVDGLKTSAYLLEEVEAKYDNSIALIYNGYIYIFTRENALKTFSIMKKHQD